MKLNATALGVVSSVLCIALIQSAGARSIRGDVTGDWPGAPLSTSVDGLSVSLPYTQAWIPNTNVPNLSDQFETPPGALLITGNSVMYTYAPPGNNFFTEEVALYTLAGNARSSMLFDPTAYSSLSSNPSLQGDVEIDVNYTDAKAASFTFGGVTYSTAGTTAPDANFLFSSEASGFKLLGFLTDGPDTGKDAGDVNVAFSTGLPSGWSEAKASAPEIDSSSAAGALTFLAGILVVLRGKIRMRA